MWVGLQPVILVDDTSTPATVINKDGEPNFYKLNVYLIFFPSVPFGLVQ